MMNAGWIVNARMRDEGRYGGGCGFRKEKTTEPTSKPRPKHTEHRWSLHEIARLKKKMHLCRHADIGWVRGAVVAVAEAVRGSGPVNNEPKK
jgi:hypothetical protein